MTIHSIYICYFGLREPLVQTQVLPYLREIKKLGEVRIRLLTFEPEIFESETHRAKLADEGIEWNHLKYHKRPSAPATLYDVLNGARFIRKLMRREKIDILHARVHTPMMMAAIARKFSRQKPKLLFDIRGFFPEEYVDAGIWPENGWLYKAVKRIEKWLLREADGFVVLTERAREILFPRENSEFRIQNSSNPKIQNLKSKNPVATAPGSDKTGRPVEVIPCCVDLKRFKTANEATRIEMRGKLGIEGSLVIAYVGAFGGWYMADETADFLEAAKAKNPHVFAMILTQSKAEMIEPLLRSRGFGEGDYLITRVPSVDIPRYLCAADMGVSFIKPCYSKQASSPTKNAEYLASGLSIVVNDGIGDTTRFTTEDETGVVIERFSREEYDAAFSEIEAALADREHIASICRESARKRFDLENVGGEKYRRLYVRLLGNRM